jgi:hypothetical protein
MKKIERIFNAQTGETNDIEVEMTPKEIAELEAKLAAVAENQKLEAEAKAAKAVLLEKLGITEDEVKLLLA